MKITKQQLKEMVMKEIDNFEIGEDELGLVPKKETFSIILLVNNDGKTVRRWENANPEDIADKLRLGDRGWVKIGANFSGVVPTPPSTDTYFAGVLESPSKPGVSVGGLLGLQDVSDTRLAVSKFKEMK